MKKLFAVLSACVVVSCAFAADKTEKPAVRKGRIKAAQREVRMLDDIYKTGIVAITQHYVNDENTIPAGTAFKLVFKTAQEKGWHQVRLVDASGEAIEDVNLPIDDFEKAAVKKLVGGESWVEEVEVRDGVSHLRVATAIPVVNEKCVMCHSNYEDVPAGQAIGALTYLVPLNGKLKPASWEK